MDYTHVRVQKGTKIQLDALRALMNDEERSAGNSLLAMNDVLLRMIALVYAARNNLDAGPTPAQRSVRLHDVPLHLLQHDVANALHALDWDADRITNVLLAIHAAHGHASKEYGEQLARMSGSALIDENERDISPWKTPAERKADEEARAAKLGFTLKKA